MTMGNFVFLDRDGVINKDGDGWTEYGYITSVADFHFIPGVLESLKKLALAGYKAVVISNQQGVGKGHYTEADLEKITSFFIKEVKKAGGHIEKAYYCTHLKADNCPCRKPKSGLFLKAKNELGIENMENSFYVGDKESDIIAGKDAGLKTIAVLTGKTSMWEIESWETRPNYMAKDLIEAAKIIIGES